MKHIKGQEFRLQNTSVTFGKFDGIHIGHQELIRRVSADQTLNSVLFTFDLNPINLFSKKEIKLLDTNEERLFHLSQYSLDYAIDYEFTPEVANMRAEDFIGEVILNKLGAKKIVVGTDFRFGKNREGDVSLLEKKSKECGYELVVVPKIERYGEEVSSTRIRKALKEGNLDLVNELLGRPFSVMGEIIHGRKLGHTVGMPTINQKPSDTKLLPPFGVYATETVLRGKVYKGITNVGTKPTIGENFVGVETWLFDFEKEVYGETARVYLLEMIRPERKFASLEELKKQVKFDVERAKNVKNPYSMEVECRT